MQKVLARKIAEWVTGFSLKDVGSDVILEVKKRFIDTASVALGAFWEDPVVIARWVAESTTGSRLPATVWGTGVRAAFDHAAFANGCAVRYLDFNDTYLSKEALHPSDMIPALVAASEVSDADGRKLVEGIIVAYDVAARLADAYSVRGRGWDHVTYIAIATAAGVSKILDLDVSKTEHAINIATTIAPALRQTRAGEISMWKACAASNAARDGLLAGVLASKGMTGPSPVFEGKFGFFKVTIGGDTFDLDFQGAPKVMETSIKYWPVEYHSMSAVEAALKIREKAGPLKPEDVEEVTVKTFTVSYKIIVEDPEKWDPKTRETADHSLPYIVSVALLDGRVWIDSFKPERVLAEDTRRVMRRMKVEVDPEYDKIYPLGIPNKVRVRTRDGRVYEEESVYPPGHYKNMLTVEQVEEKFWRLAKGLVDESRASKFLREAWRLEDVGDLGRLMRLLTVKS
ncbi:MAG: MmgE/PrpD family protein [Desulfurococcaceae archaeon]|nr:MmgE/PrpD family protein [Desulfurococcaceae archaeon]